MPVGELGESGYDSIRQFIVETSFAEVLKMFTKELLQLIKGDW